MTEKTKKLISTIAYPLVIVGGIGVVWQILAVISGSEFIMPKPASAIKEFFAILSSLAFYEALGETLFRVLLSYAVSFVFALGFALLSVLFPPVKILLSPLVSIVRALPTMAVVLILVIWTGAKTAPIIVSLLVIMPTIYSAFEGAFSGVDKDFIDVCRVNGGGKRALVKEVYLPIGLPNVTHSVSGALSLTVKLMIASEVLANTAGSIGAMMQTSRVYFETATLMALTVWAVIVSLVMEKLLYLLLSKLWKK